MWGRTLLLVRMNSKVSLLKGPFMKAIHPRYSAFCIILYSALLHNSMLTAQALASPPLMPMPSHLTLGEGQLPIDGGFSVKIDGYSEPRLVAARTRFLDTLSRETGIPFGIDPQASATTLTIKAAGPSEEIQASRREMSHTILQSLCHRGTAHRENPARHPARPSVLPAACEDHSAGHQPTGGHH